MCLIQSELCLYNGLKSVRHADSHYFIVEDSTENQKKKK